MCCWKSHKKQAWLTNSVVWSNASGGFLTSQVDWSSSAPMRFVLPASWVTAGEVFALPLAWPPPHHYAGWWFPQLAWLCSPVVWGSCSRPDLQETSTRQRLGLVLWSGVGECWDAASTPVPQDNLLSVAYFPEELKHRFSSNNVRLNGMLYSSSSTALEL